jgi:hypothetical protein
MTDFAAALAPVARLLTNSDAASSAARATPNAAARLNLLLDISVAPLRLV